MSELFKPLYHDTDSVTVSKSIEEQNKKFLRSMLNSNYGLKENDMRIKDFIVLHADGQPIMVKKEAIAAISKMSDGTTRVDISNHIWITEDRYDDVIKRLFEV